MSKIAFKSRVKKLKDSTKHYENFKKLFPGLVEIRGVCARTLKSAETFAGDAGVAFATDDLNALMAREDIDVIDNLPADLTGENTVGSGDGLHQGVLLEWFIQIQSRNTGRIKAS